MEPRKQAICDALARFIRQRPGLEFGNYGDVKAYRSELRSITKDRHHAETLLRAVMSHDSITADDLIRAAHDAYSGRLTITTDDDEQLQRHVTNGDHFAARIDYVTGQYFPTEYRRAVCAVLASALWYWTRGHAMPEPTNTDGDGNRLYPDHVNRSVVSAGDWLRAHFRREFGRGIASRWFS